MNTLITIFTILAIFDTSSTTKHLNYSHPDYPHQCYVSTSLILKEGETVMAPWKFCANLLCQKEGMAVLATCDDYLYVRSVLFRNVEKKNNCHLGELLFPTDPYPKCCNRLIECPLKSDPQKRRAEPLYSNLVSIDKKLP